MHLKWKRSKVSLTNASGANTKVLGEAEVYCAAKNGGTKKICFNISSDLVDNMLLGWQSQIALRMLHQSWPNVLFQAKCQQVNHEEENRRKSRKDKFEKEKGRKQQDFPVDEKYKEVRKLLDEYKDIFHDEMDTSDMLAGHRITSLALPCQDFLFYFLTRSTVLQ